MSGEEGSGDITILWTKDVLIVKTSQENEEEFTHTVSFAASQQQRLREMWKKEGGVCLIYYTSCCLVGPRKKKKFRTVIVHPKFETGTTQIKVKRAT